MALQNRRMEITSLYSWRRPEEEEGEDEEEEEEEEEGRGQKEGKGRRKRYVGRRLTVQEGSEGGLARQKWTG